MPKLGAKIAMFKLQTLEIRCERTRMDACLSCKRAVQALFSAVSLGHQRGTARNSVERVARGIQNLGFSRCSALFEAVPR